MGGAKGSRVKDRGAESGILGPSLAGGKGQVWGQDGGGGRSGSGRWQVPVGWLGAPGTRPTASATGGGPPP